MTSEYGLKKSGSVTYAQNLRFNCFQNLVHTSCDFQLQKRVKFLFKTKMQFSTVLSLNLLQLSTLEFFSTKIQQDLARFYRIDMSESTSFICLNQSDRLPLSQSDSLPLSQSDYETAQCTLHTCLRSSALRRLSCRITHPYLGFCSVSGNSNAQNLFIFIYPLYTTVQSVLLGLYNQLTGQEGTTN